MQHLTRKKVAEVQMQLHPKHEMVDCDYVVLSMYRTVDTEILTYITAKNSVRSVIDIDLKHFFRSKDNPTIRK